MPLGTPLTAVKGQSCDAQHHLANHCLRESLHPSPLCPSRTEFRRLPANFSTTAAAPMVRSRATSSTQSLPRARRDLQQSSDNSHPADGCTHDSAARSIDFERATSVVHPEPPTARDPSRVHGKLRQSPSNDVDPLRFLLQLSPAPSAFAVVQQLIPLRYTRRRGTCMRGLLQSQTRCLSHHLLRSQTVPCAMAERRGIDCATNGCTLRVSRLICSPASSACATTTCYRFKCAMLCFIVSDCPRRAC
jgi:hypothetical protein